MVRLLALVRPAAAHCRPLRRPGLFSIDTLVARRSSGQGSCVDAVGLCLCNPGFRAGADLFDLRVAYDPASESWLQTDCSGSNDGMVVV